MLFLSLILCLCLSGSANAAENNGTSPMVGVQTHVMGYPANYKLTEMFKTLHSGAVREELRWQLVEKVKGKFILDPRMSKYIDDLNALNIKPVLILDYSNMNYTKTPYVGPNTLELRKAFGDYASFMVSNLKGKVYAWEIWNEPYTQTPAKNFRDYNLLVKYVAPIIHRIDPQALVVAGASLPDPQMLSDLEKANALADVDIISMHWYTYPGPPDKGYRPIYMDLASVRAFIQKAKGLGKRVWITEMGYPTSTDRYGVSEAQQAEYTKKQIELAGKMGVEVCIIYDLIDDGPDPGNLRDRHGLFRRDGSPKPAASVVPMFAH